MRSADRDKTGATVADPQYLDANVLVIGGGFAGIFAARRAAQLTDGVILAEKAFVSRSGASTVSGGVTTAPFRDDDLRPWAEELITRSGFTANQEWTWQLLEDQIDRVGDLIDLGVPIVRDAEGSIKRVLSRGMVAVRVLQYVPRLAMEALRADAIAKGARVLDRFNVTDLITSDGRYPTGGRVCGAVGFDARTAQPVVIRARQTIVTTGMLHVKGRADSGVESNTGDGSAMALRAGARFVDMEFGVGGTFTILEREFRFGNFNIAVAHGAVLRNALGERFMERYDRVRFERSELGRVVAAFTKEVLDGRGPVYLDLRTCDDSFWQTLRTVRGKAQSPIQSGRVPDPTRFPTVIEPKWSVANLGEGGMRIDLGCRTNVPGLLAAGAVARNEAVGRHSSAGTPTAFCFVSGHRAGESAARAATDGDFEPADLSHAGELAMEALRPWGRSGRLTTDDVHNEIAAAVGGLPELLQLDGDKISAVIARLRRIPELLTETAVDSPHELVKWHEARNSALAAELEFACMADRTESRESFYRQDFPETDDFAWRCWHGARLTKGGLVFDKEEIPFDRYEFQPPPPTRYLGAVGAIMLGRYDEQVYEPQVGAVEA